jgi:recombination protein RecA
MAGQAVRPLEELAANGIRRGLAASAVPVAWGLGALSGRLAEISGSHSCASLTLVFRLVLEAQTGQEPVAWITRRESVFFPPDAAATGVDLGALAVVWAPGTRRAARAADHLLRSGAFGLVVLDVGVDDRLAPPMQTRLAGLAHKHGSALVCITEKDGRRPSLGSLVSLRAEAVRTRPEAGDRFRCEVRVLKDKRRGPGWAHVEVCHGPDGLC